MGTDSGAGRDSAVGAKSTAVPDVGLTSDDRGHLERARALGRRGWGHVHPNPMVGCVLVRDGMVVGEGWHEEFGGPHAEIVALEAAGEDARGATAYVSLEPCDHEGKTPPCSHALLRSGVRRVVFGAADPGRESGGGAETLRRGGVEVIGPVWSEAEGRRENPAFFHTARHGTPYVALKLALTLDGRIARAPGLRTRITGPEAAREVHRLRAGFDAVMVGAGTARTDDPELTVRLAPAGRAAPRRIVLDPGASLPAGSALLKGVAEAPVHVFVAEGAEPLRAARLHASGSSVHEVPTGRGGLDLRAVLDACPALGIRSILCEGGGRLAASMLEEDHVHRLYLFLAPFTLGDDAVPAFPGVAREVWDRYEAAREPRAFGRDILVVMDRRE